MAITGAISAEREKKKGGNRFAGKKEWNKHMITAKEWVLHFGGAD